MANESKEAKPAEAGGWESYALILDRKLRRLVELLHVMETPNLAEERVWAVHKEADERYDEITMLLEVAGPHRERETYIDRQNALFGRMHNAFTARMAEIQARRAVGNADEKAPSGTKFVVTIPKADAKVRTDRFRNERALQPKVVNNEQNIPTDSSSTSKPKSLKRLTETRAVEVPNRVVKRTIADEEQAGPSHSNENPEPVVAPSLLVQTTTTASPAVQSAVVPVSAVRTLDPSQFVNYYQPEHWTFMTAGHEARVNARQRAVVELRGFYPNIPLSPPMPPRQLPLFGTSLQETIPCNNIIVGWSEFYVQRPLNQGVIFCPHCKIHGHMMHNCVAFSGQTFIMRWHSALTDGVCLNCLRWGHSSWTCRHAACKRCNLKHNSLLCWNIEHHR